MTLHCTFCGKISSKNTILDRTIIFKKADEGMLMFLYSGRLMVRTEKIISDSEDHMLHEGNVMLIRPGYDKCNLYSEEDVEFQQIVFKGEPDSTIPKIFAPYDSVGLLRLIYILEDYKRRYYPENFIDSFLSLLIGEISVQCSSMGIPEAPLYNRIREYIDANSDHELTITDIAAHFNYSTRYISRIFRRFHNDGIKNYIVSARINQIKLILMTTDLTLKEISEKLGFRDYKLMLKYYTYHEKMSPTAFRALFANKSN